MSKEVTLKLLSYINILGILFQSFVPSIIKASGPVQPEFSGFGSVSTNNMVDPFTGDFAYNLPVIEIPGPHGSSYPLTLSYHSSLGVEEEASWVGFGWSLNPGAIIRNKRGFADDVKDGAITYYNKMPVNKTTAVSTDLSASVGAFGAAAANAGYQTVLQNNTYKGLSLNFIPYAGYQLGAKSFSIQYDVSEGKWRHDYQMNHLWFMQTIGSVAKQYIRKNYDMNFISNSLLNQVNRTFVSATAVNNVYRGYSLFNNSFPTTFPDYDGSSFSITLGLGAGFSAVDMLGGDTGDAGSSSDGNKVTSFVSDLLTGGIGYSISGNWSKQENDATKSNQVFQGYMYSYNADERHAMDYVVERDGAFNLRDKYLPIPFSMADHFNVVGEGIGGAFRAYSNKAGEFYPKEVNSGIDIDGAGIQGQVTLTGISGTFSYTWGTQKTDVEGWSEDEEYKFSAESGYEPYYFRFMGDMGGYADMGSIYATKASLSGSSGDYTYSSSVLDDEVNNGDGVRRSSFIGYHTNEQITGYYPFLKYSLREDIEEMVDRETSPNQIGEYSIVNKDGIRYNYGIPVYAQKEYNYSYNIDPNEDDIVNHTLAYKESDEERKIGNYITTPYATTYLLTEIIHSNYIDRTMDGPSDDDYGGWTKFNYTKRYGDKHNMDGGSDDWFKWRAPYTGLQYNPGRLSDTRDDMGSCSGGEKEIYYLESVETKTHIAVFETSSRSDAYEALENEQAIDYDKRNLKGSKTLEKLESIRLYKKDADGEPEKLLKTVKFDYGYDLMDNAPGSYYGKLTLKEVWFEYEDVKGYEYPKYKFSYQYPQNNSDDQISYPEKYKYDCPDVDNGTVECDPTDQEVTDEYAEINDFVDGLTELPDYEPYLTDRWGHYRSGGDDMSDYFKDWVDQTPDPSFDAAVWHLKRIQLPTGGEIHVQYEQDEYAYVQNRRAMVMVSLDEVESGGECSDNYPGLVGDKYYLNLTDLFDVDNDGNIDSGEEEDAYTEQLPTIKKWMEKIYINGIDGRDPEKIYFKFFYNLEGTATPGWGECDGEFIDGYIEVDEVSISDDNRIYLTFKGSDCSGTENDKIDCPREACIDFYAANKDGLNQKSNCDLENATGDDDVSGIGGALQVMYAVLEESLTEYDSYVCLNLNEEFSYLRIPVPEVKKGGGVRVKRLLTYDPGIEDDPMVYGHEYVYQLEDGSSSGVAANEPGIGKEENALIGYIKKRKASNDEQTAAVGDDNTQFQGPIGESILPGPSVGYSRVAIKNIHSDYTHDGITVQEFYTAKDFPSDEGVSYTEIDIKKHEPNPQYGLFGVNVKFSMAAAQGYSFVINNMHGKQKKVSFYSGDYEDMNSPAELNMISSSEYEYFEPGEELPVMNYLGESNADEPLGMDMEIIAESRSFSDVTKTSTISLTIGITYTGIPYGWINYYYTNDDTELRTHATTKTTFYPSVLKSTTNYQNGAFKTITNKYFNPNTGAVVLAEMSGSYDNLEFEGETHNGKYYAYTIPASWNYEGTTAKSGSEGIHINCDDDNILSTKGASSGNTILNFSGSKSDNLTGLFYKGDFIRLLVPVGSSSVEEYYFITKIVDKDIYLEESVNFPLGAVTAFKDQSGVELDILWSGKTNQLNLNIGDILAYGDYDDSFTAYDITIDEDTYDSRNDIASYLNKQLQGKIYSTEPENAYYEVSIIDPETGNCTRCSTEEEPGESWTRVDPDDLRVIEEKGIDIESMISILDYLTYITLKSSTVVQESEALIESMMDDMWNIIRAAATDGDWVPTEEWAINLKYEWDVETINMVKDMYGATQQENFVTNYGNMSNFIASNYSSATMVNKVRIQIRP